MPDRRARSRAEQIDRKHEAVTDEQRGDRGDQPRYAGTEHERELAADEPAHHAGTTSSNARNTSSNGASGSPERARSSATVPHATMRPAESITIRSATSSALRI